MPPVSPPRPPSGPGVPPAGDSRREPDRDGRGKRTAFEFDAFAQQASEADATRDKHTVFGMTASEFEFNPHGAGSYAPPPGNAPGQVAVNRAQGIGQHPASAPHAPASQPFAFSNASLTTTAPHGFAVPLAPPPASPSHRAPAHGGPYEQVAQVAQQVHVVKPVHVAVPLPPPPPPAPYAHASHGAGAPHVPPASQRDRTPATVFAAPAYVPEAPTASRSPDYARHAGGFQPVLTPPAARQPASATPPYERQPAPATPHYDVVPQARHEPGYALPAAPSAPLPTTQPSLPPITSHARPTAAMDAQQLLKASIELPEFGGSSSSASRPVHDRGDSSSGWPAPADESDSSRWRVSHDPDLDGDRTRDSDDSASRWPARKDLPAHASSRSPSGKAKYAEARSVEKPMQLRGKFSSDDDADVDRVLGRKLSHGKLLIGACALALLFCAGAFYIKASRSEPVLAAAPATAATQEVQRPGAQRQQTRPAPVEPAPAEPTSEGERQLAAREAPARKADVASATEPTDRDEDESAGKASEQIPVGSPVPETSAERRRAARHERRQLLARAPEGALRHGSQAEATPEPEAEAPAPVQPELAAPAEPAPVQGGVTERSAAALYINGKYKEAHAEYLLLAQAHPKQRVYVELARILRRRLIETCVRTQPHRREQCREL